MTELRCPNVLDIRRKHYLEYPLCDKNGKFFLQMFVYGTRDKFIFICTHFVQYKRAHEPQTIFKLEMSSDVSQIMRGIFGLPGRF